MNVEEARALFPGTRDQIYLNASLNGLVPTTAREGAVAHMEKRVLGRAVKDDLHAQAERVRGQVAHLLHARPEEIAITKNVSEGLNLFAAGVDWKPGDNVVLCEELEHPNNVFLWYNLRETRGVEIRKVAPDEGRVPVDRMVQAMDGRTRVATASHITFSPGFVTDIATLAEEAHARGALALVDAAQSAGCYRIDVGSLGVDGLALGTQKALLALYGLGFMYVRRRVAEELTPVYAARYGMDLGPEAHETAIGPGKLSFKPGALRFDLSNYNYLGLATVEPALALIHAIGVGEIQRHVGALAARLASGLLDLGLPVAGGTPGPHLAHIVALGESGGGRHDDADDPAMNDLFRHLSRHGVNLSIRRGVLRMSVGLYNNHEEINRVLELCEGWLDGR